MRSRSGFLYTFCVYSRILVHVQWTGTVEPAGCRPCYNHVTGAWLSRQLICCGSVLSRMLVERQWVYTVVSQQLAGIERTFNGFVVKTGIDACDSRGQVYGRCWVYERRVYGRSSLRTLSLRTLSSLQTSSLRTLSSLQTWVLDVWRNVEPAWTREVRRGSCGAWWRRERSFDDRRSTGGDVRDRLTTREFDLVPVCSSTRWTLGRVDSRFVLEFVYRVACWCDRRPTSLKDTFLRRITVSIIYLFL